MQRLDLLPVNIDVVPRHVAVKDYRSLALAYQRSRQLITIRENQHVYARFLRGVLRRSIRCNEHTGERHECNCGHTANADQIQARQGFLKTRHLCSPPEKMSPLQ